DYRRAIECHENCLKIALERSDLGEKRISYNNLGGAYTELGDCKRAIVFHEKALKITLELGSLEGEGMVYGNLGITYYKKGEYEKAITYQQKALKIAQETGDSEAEGRAYGNLGIFYQGIGEYKRALIYQEKELNIFLELGNLDSEAKCYGNLGATYYKFGDFRKAITYHEKTLKAALERGNLGAEGNAYNNLGIAYKGLGEYQKAITYHENHLKIALGLGDRGKEGGVYNNLGTVYQDLGEHSRAITYYNKFLNIALESGDLAGQKSVYYHLGIAYDSVKDLNQAEHYFRKGISVTATLLHQAKESKWQIPFFEQGSLSYRGLEEVLLKQEKYQEALQASDRRRGRALSFLISQKLLPKERENNALEGVTLQRITDLAKKFHTTFIIYSRVFMKYKEVPLQAWVISSRNKCIQSVVLPPLDHDFLKPHPLFKQFPYVIRAKRPQRTYPQTPYQGGLKEEKRPSQLFDETLVFWYKNLIAPLEPYLPAKHSGETLTFIPDHFLAHLPFGAFYNEKEDQYLIENYPIAVAPSIEVLSLLDQLPQESCKEVLLMGNPVTAQKEDHPLPYTESEVRDTIAPMVANLTVHLFTQNQATPAAVLAHAPFARLIHIACHGVGDQKPLEKPDPHSVFEGLFKLAPDHDHPMGHLHAEEIALMHLKADLVFMSACHLGRGNLKQEGSIGPVWSFLGAGAKSTISSYWPLPEGETTVKMVETFYRHYLGIGTPKLGKAHALQQAVLMVMQTERKRPRQWGALFLSGLIDEKG
ncbi:MAG: CHAT domain-containing tetratricopeptide repeat protein, partial [Candidatus Rhabdochlamydia sp.]